MHKHCHTLYHDRHGRPMASVCLAQQSPETREAFNQAILYVEQLQQEGRLLSPWQAMALAGDEARRRETLYSVAQKFGRDEQVDLIDLLHDLEQRFPDYK